LLLFFFPFLGIICSILALVFYNNQKKLHVSDMATAGLVIGIVGLVINGILLIIFLSGIAWALMAVKNAMNNSTLN
jgi:hypothetical protein